MHNEICWRASYPSFINEWIWRNWQQRLQSRRTQGYAAQEEPVFELWKTSWGLNFSTVRAQPKLWCKSYVLLNPQCIIWQGVRGLRKQLRGWTPLTPPGNSNIGEDFTYTVRVSTYARARGRYTCSTRSTTVRAMISRCFGLLAVRKPTWPA